MGTDVRCLLIHGFGGNPEDLKHLVHYLESEGYAVACPTLKGHTGTREDLVSTTYMDWIFSAEESFRSLAKRDGKVALVGYSMGGLIALNLAAKYGTAALVTLNTPVYVPNLRRVFENIRNDLVTGSKNHIKRYLGALVSIPVKAYYNFMLLLKRSLPLLEAVSCPVFVGQGLNDDAVDFKSAEYIYSKAASRVKMIKFYEGVDHMICRSSNNAAVFQDVAGFLASVCG